MCCNPYAHGPFTRLRITEGTLRGANFAYNRTAWVGTGLSVEEVETWSFNPMSLFAMAIS